MTTLRKANQAMIAKAVAAMPNRRSIKELQRNYPAILADTETTLAKLPKDRRITKPKLGRPATGRRPLISLRVPADLLAWYKATGPGYQSRMIAVLEQERHHA